MPSTIADLFVAARVRREGVVAWGTRIPAPDREPGTGIYIVALTADADTARRGARDVPAVGRRRPRAPRRPAGRARARRPPHRRRAIRRPARGVLCADEVALYGGRAGPRKQVVVSPLSDRVAEYYTTPLGARSPHAGGWPLKTLDNLALVELVLGKLVRDAFGKRPSATCFGPVR